MEAQIRTSPLFLIQELLDLIIESVPFSLPDLRSCALVATPWTRPAHSRLFSVLAFTPEYNLYMAARAASNLRHSRRLDGLEVSPHIARLVRHVKLSSNPHWLAPVASRLHFPNLREVTVRAASARYNSTVIESMRRGVSMIQAYLFRTGLQRVNLSGYFPISVLNAYFEGCALGLTALALDLRNIGSEAPTQGPAIPPAPPTGREIQLSHLAVSNPNIISRWLLQQRMFAFAHLTSLEVDARTWTALQQQEPLAGWLAFVETLVLTDFPSHATAAAFTKLPALRLLDVAIRPVQYPELLLLLRTLEAPSQLQVVTIRFDIQVYEEELSFNESTFKLDASKILAAHPSVRRVDVARGSSLMMSFFAEDLSG